MAAYLRRKPVLVIMMRCTSGFRGWLPFAQTVWRREKVACFAGFASESRAHQDVFPDAAARIGGSSGITFNENSSSAWTFTAGLSIPALDLNATAQTGTPTLRRGHSSSTPISIRLIAGKCA